MEIRIDARGGVSQGIAPSDTFVSLRVGEVQKQSRFAESRTYRFPAPAKGGQPESYGRIEIFKRIGHATVKFDGFSGAAKDVDVPCDFPGCKTIALSLAVKGGGVEETLPQLKEGSRSRARERKDAAQRYLDDYHLEDTLAEAMKELIRVKPKDPHAFLSSHILKRSSGGGDGITLPPLQMNNSASAPALPPLMPGAGGKRSRPGTRERPDKKLPPIGGPVLPQAPQVSAPLPPKAPVQMLAGSDAKRAPQGGPALPSEFGEYCKAHFTSIPSSELASLYSKFSAPPKVMFPTTSAKPQPELTNFSAYYGEHIAGPESSAFSSLYAKFGAAPRVEFKAGASSSAAPAAALTDFKAYYNQNINGPESQAFAGLFAKFGAAPRVEFKAAAPKQASLANFKDYYTENMTGSTPDAFASLYAKFGAAPRVEMKASAVASTAIVAAAPSPKFLAFVRQPSVGSWLAAPRPKLWTPAPAAEPSASAAVAIAASSSQAAWKSLPSVGTWLGRPLRRNTAAPEATASSAAAPATTFMFKPSVGTWLAPRPTEAMASSAAAPAGGGSASFMFKPSVGTWLAPRPTEATASSAAAPASVSSASFMFKPSVGTWLAPRPSKAAAVATASAAAASTQDSGRRFGQQASVGTWLAVRRTSTEKVAVALTATTGTLKRTLGKPAEVLSTMATMTKEDILTVVKSELTERDEEIAALKAELARLKQH